MPTDPQPRHVVIVGAGLAGALLACFLARRGWTIDVFERRSDPRRAGPLGGRSINLALSTRGLTALDRVDLADAILQDAVPMRGWMLHARTGSLAFQPYSADPRDAINSVSRSRLNITLIEAADRHDNVNLHFGHRCIDVDPDAPSATFRLVDGSTRTVPCDAVIGADGAFSAVRSRLQRLDRFDLSQTWLEHGYKELTIPPTGEGDFAIEPNALHIWPRGGFMMIALPNADRSFTCTLFWPFQGPTGFEAVANRRDVLPFFERHFPDAIPLMPTLVDDFLTNPVGSLVTIRCRPWNHVGKVLLIGDAAHAIVPFYGQGINAGFEDCRILDRILDEHADDLPSVFDAFSRTRKPDADAIADLALANFIEMRDKVASPIFRLRKRAQRVAHMIAPGTYHPLYNLISFSNVPYAQAVRGARRQGWAAAALGGALVLLVLSMLLAMFVSILGP